MKSMVTDKDAPFLPTLNALGMWAVGMTSLYVVYKSALANAPKPVAVGLGNALAPLSPAEPP